MAPVEFKLAVNNAKFPFIYSRAGRGVLNAGLDVAQRTGMYFTGSEESIDFNTVEMLYAENVLPIAEGIMSVACRQAIASYGAVTDFDQLITLRDAQENNYLFSPGRGKNYLYSEGTGLWSSLSSFSWAAGKTLVTRAYVNGRTFVCYESDRVIEYNPGGPSFTTIALTLPGGYAMSDIRGIAGASNYLLLFTNTEILWCSLLDITNFSDPIGKAGKQTPIDLKGQITCIVPISGGVIVYTNRNAVAGFFTNNADTPFSFREVQNSGGVAGYEQVTSDANQAAHYTYGTSGIQRLTLQLAETVLPDCADFLASRMYEYWDATNKIVQETLLTGTLEVKLQFLGNRYLTISYGKISNQFTFALFYDEVLKRWGKVRVNHVDVSTLPSTVINAQPMLIQDLSGQIQSYTQLINALISTFGVVTPSRTGFCFLQQDGTVQVLIADPAAIVDGGVALFGRIQIVRNRTVQFIGVQWDGFYNTSGAVCTVVGSEPKNGYDRNKIWTPSLYQYTDKMRQYRGRAVFENFDIAVEGKFALSAGTVECMPHGSR